MKPDPVRELVRRLNAVLGPTLVSTLAGATDIHAASEWARAGAATPPEFEANLRLGYRALTAISTAESPHLAYGWFIASNPMLNDDSPVQAIREGRHRQVVAALTVVVAGTWAG